MIGILGCGFVGGTHKEAFEYAGYVNQLVCVDTKIEGSSAKDLRDCGIVFCALPTPTTDGVQDLSIMKSVFGELAALKFRGIIVIKSTIVPGTSALLANQFNLNIVHSPEFLRERCAFEDFKAQTSILLSGRPFDTAQVARLYKNVMASFSDNACEVLEYENYAVTETAKYFHNCFLATKVVFANEMFNACAKIGVNYDEVLEATKTQGGIGEGHLSVPGPDGQRGFSGTCFPKDVRAFLAIAPDMMVLQAAESSNKKGF